MPLGQPISLRGKMTNLTALCRASSAIGRPSKYDVLGKCHLPCSKTIFEETPSMLSITNFNDKSLEYSNYRRETIGMKSRNWA